MDAQLSARLAEVVGEHAIAGEVISPADPAAVAAVARILGESRTPVCVTSGAPSAHRGAPEGVVVLSVHRLTIVQAAAPSLTLRVGAGVTVDHVRDAATQHRLAVVGLGMASHSGHAGSMVARGEVPRRSLAGIEAVLMTGEEVRAGGGALKDVVGYDLIAALLGSGGQLAVIVAVTFRLEPAAVRTAAAKPAGAQSWHPALAGAFDPQGLLRPGG